MSAYVVGDPVEIVWTTAVDGVPTDPTSQTLVVTMPDGTAVSPAITTSPVGTHRAVVTATQDGDHFYEAVATGAAAGVEQGQFHVDPRPGAAAFLPLLATVEELEARLRRTLTGADRVAALADLEDASNLARVVAAVPDPVPAGVRALVLKAARRGFENPQGAVSETIGAYSYRLSNGGDGEGNSGVYYTEAEAGQLRAACTAGPALAVGSIRLGVPAGY